MAGLRQLVVLAAVLVAFTVRANPTLQTLRDAPQEDIVEAATYLTRYGYLSTNPTEDKSGSLVMSLSDKIAEFQAFAGLERTGVLDEATIAKMRQPRCGVKDKLGPSYRARRRRRKRYALQGSRWRRKNLKYKIMSWPSRLINNRDGVREAIRNAFDAWARVSALTFEEVEASARANIEIRFAKGDHGDGDAFDGRGGTLAHAFFPLFGGDAHFDDDERWKLDLAARGTDVFTVAAHELGHSLGLSHSDDSRALMAPFYKPPGRNRDVIKEDDIKGIQELYGPPPVVNPQPVPRQPGPDSSGPTEPDENEIPTEPDQNLCLDSSVDAMVTVTFGSAKKTYAFKGDQYWRLTRAGVEQGYPRLIRDGWKGIPDNLDAILPYEDSNRIYFFKGNQYWRWTNLTADDGYPKLISNGFPGVPDNIDAAFRWVANGKMYFFKGSQYYRFETDLSNSGRPGVSDRYPRPISVWRGIPDNIDSAMTYENKRTYFFKGDIYYRFNDATFTVDSSYPRFIGRYWFGCRSNLVTPSDRDARGDQSGYDGDDAGSWQSSTAFTT